MLVLVSQTTPVTQRQKGNTPEKSKHTRKVKKPRAPRKPKPKDTQDKDLGSRAREEKYPAETQPDPRA